jgi:hypothetical protein
MAMPGWTKNFGLARMAAGRGTPEGESAYNQAAIADRDAGNAKVFEAAQAQFGDQGSQRLLQNSEGHYYLPQSANPRRRTADGDTNWVDSYVGAGPGIADTEGLNDAKGILGVSSGLAQADAYDMMMNRARGSQGMKPMQTNQDRRLSQFEQALQYLK